MGWSPATCVRQKYYSRNTHYHPLNHILCSHTPRFRIAWDLFLVVKLRLAAGYLFLFQYCWIYPLYYLLKPNIQLNNSLCHYLTTLLYRYHFLEFFARLAKVSWRNGAERVSDILAESGEEASKKLLDKYRRVQCPREDSSLSGTDRTPCGPRGWINE
jgi:hypothetical protein